MARRLVPDSSHLPLLYFGLSILLLVFASGVTVGRFKFFPYDVLAGAWSAAEDWRQNWRAYLRERPDRMIKAARFAGQGVVVHLPDKASAGVTLITSLWHGEQGIDLLALNGTLLHRWRVSFNEIWPQASHLNEQPQDWDSYIHGSLLYPNGDVVFNFDYKGLVKLDKCGDVVWKVSHPTHHSVFQDDDGNLWVGTRRRVAEPLPRLPNLSAPFDEEVIIEVSPDGEVLRQIALTDVFLSSQYEAVLFANGRENVERLEVDGPEVMHMNDVEVLSSSLAKQFPLFSAGDIMVSLRNLNLIVIIDGQTERIKWSQVGPYLRQHDPDFLPNGKISLFDNRRDEVEGGVLGGSRILELDPATHEVSTVYASDSKNFFYTNALGKHQRLSNGNILITEGEAGRAFEVAPDGQVVWSYVNRWDEDEVVWIEEATRYPTHYADFAKEECR